MLPSRINKAELWQEHAKKFDCSHSQSELRERTIKGGSKQYVRQCLKCGSAVSNPIKREAALSENNGNPLPFFDEQLISSWDAAAKESATNITNTDDSEFWAAYEQYLAGPLWAKKREKVFERASGICEGCRDKPANQVHHLSYEHVGDEYLFELVAICDECHGKLHSET